MAHYKLAPEEIKRIEALSIREIDALIWLMAQTKGDVTVDDVSLYRCRYVDGDVQPHAGYPVGHISPPHYVAEAIGQLIGALRVD